MKPFRLLQGLILTTWMTTVAFATDPQPPSADELFSLVSAIRQSASATHISDPGAFSRERLEEALRNIDSSAEEPSRPGLNWERDTLLTSLAWLHWFDEVYSYALSSTELDPIALSMQVTVCGKYPSMLTLGFRYEEGLWRIHSMVSSSVKSSTSWFREGLQPVKSWPHVPSRDRSRYFNESRAGKSLGMNVKPKKEEC